MKRTILVLAVVSSVANAHAWKHVASGSISNMFVDRSSIKKSGSTVVYWRKVEYPVTRYVGNARYNSKLIKEKADCLDHKSAVLEETAYLDGISVHSHRSPDEWEYAAPGTVMEAVIRTACAAK